MNGSFSDRHNATGMAQTFYVSMWIFTWSGSSFPPVLCSLFLPHTYASQDQTVQKKGILYIYFFFVLFNWLKIARLLGKWATKPLGNQNLPGISDRRRRTLGSQPHTSCFTILSNIVELRLDRLRIYEEIEGPTNKDALRTSSKKRMQFQRC